MKKLMKKVYRKFMESSRSKPMPITEKAFDEGPMMKKHSARAEKYSNRDTIARRWK